MTWQITTWPDRNVFVVHTLKKTVGSIYSLVRNIWVAYHEYSRDNPLPQVVNRFPVVITTHILAVGKTVCGKLKFLTIVKIALSIKLLFQGWHQGLKHYKCNKKTRSRPVLSIIHLIIKTWHSLYQLSSTDF